MMFRFPYPIAPVVSGILWLTATSMAQTQTDSVVSTDEQQIRQAIVAFVENYNAHEADALLSLFADDARYVGKDGTELRGHDELRSAFIEAIDANPKAAVSVTVDEIRFLAPDVAVEQGRSTYYPDGETASSENLYTVVHVKKEGKWLIQSTRIDREQTLTNYEYLQPLEWLVGNWVDEGRNEVIEVSWKFTDNKNYLVQEFQVVRENEILLQGTQRVGWDPQTQQLRCWVFDSDGGFAEGTWTLVDGQWICKSTGVLRDGTSASGTRVLTQVASDRVLWVSKDRLFGNEALPDLEVTMVRKPPVPADTSEAP
jgi:uncharacterized protein (TIGR02246 family)